MQNFKTHHSTPSPQLQFINPQLDEISAQEAAFSVVVTDDALPETVLSYILDFGILQVVQASNLEWRKEISVAAQMLIDGRGYLNFPLSSILDPENVSAAREQELQIFQCTFNSSSETAMLVEQTRREVLKFAKQSLADEIGMVMEELSSNAVYNAPLQSEDEKAPAELHGKFEVRTEKSSVLFLGRDQDRVIAGCVDLYGTLDAPRMLHKVRDCYKPDAQNLINMQRGGAGIGSFMVLNSCSSYYLGLERGQRTVICCAFPINGGAKIRQAIPKNLHLVLLD